MSAHPILVVGGGIVCGGFLVWNIAFATHWLRTDFIPSLKRRRSLFSYVLNVAWGLCQFLGLPIIMIASLKEIQLVIALSTAAVLGYIGYSVRR